MNFERIEAVAEEYPASVVCEVLGVSRSGLYAYRARTRRPLTPRERENTKLDHTIATVFDEGRRSYGRPRMQRALRARGIRIGDNRLRKKMRQMGLVAKPKRRFRKTTDSDHDSPIAPNLLEQDFNAKAPNRVWCSDITYVRTWAGWVYVCVIIDLFSRKVVGWAAADHLRAELVTDAFDMAIGRRLVEPGLIFHSDRGGQFASRQLRRRLTRFRMRQSMSRRGNCYDNAVVESFNDKLKQELVHRHSWPTRERVCLAIADYIERFYNPVRLHSTLGYLSPNDFEDLHRGAESLAA